jgi:hypothetical protein
VKKTAPSNFKPISLLITFSKILEKVMYNRLSQHLYVMKTDTSKIQFSEKEQHCTTIYILTNNNFAALNVSSQIVRIFCDLATVFDRENHILLDNQLLR